jgi:uncharacterized membrane protein
MVKTVPATTPAATYGVGVSVTTASSSTTGNGNITVKPSSVISSCSQAAPTVTLSPSNPSAFPGENVTYNVSITNNDTNVCASKSFSLAALTPSGWPTAFSQASVTIAPSSSAAISMVKTVPATTPAATYGVGVSVTTASSSTTGNGNITVKPSSVPSLSITLSVPTLSFSRSSTVPLTARVTQGAARAPGASVLFTIVRPDSRTVVKTVTTDSTGQATWKYRVGPKDLKGAYTVTAWVTLGSQSSTSNSVTFNVQ